MKFFLPDDIPIDGITFYNHTNGGIRIAAVLDDGTPITIEDIDAGGRAINVPDTHKVIVVTHPDGSRVVRIHREA